MDKEQLFALLQYNLCQEGTHHSTDTFGYLASKGYIAPGTVGCAYMITDKGEEFIKKVIDQIKEKDNG